MLNKLLPHNNQIKTDLSLDQTSSYSYPRDDAAEHAQYFSSSQAANAFHWDGLGFKHSQMWKQIIGEE